jgi:hypothetical protein
MTVLHSADLLCDRHTKEPGRVALRYEDASPWMDAGIKATLFTERNTGTALAVQKDWKEKLDA